MGRVGIIIGIAIVAYMAFFIWPSLMRHSGDGLSLGSQFPPVALDGIDGSEISLPPAGADVTVFNVWATWCAPCRRELPMLQALEQRWRPQGVRFILGNEEINNKNNVIGFLRQMNIDLPNYFMEASDSQAMGGIASVPTTFVLDRQGRLANRYVGIVSYEQLNRAIEALVTNKPGLK